MYIYIDLNMHPCILCLYNFLLESWAVGELVTKLDVREETSDEKEKKVCEWLETTQMRKENF